jgi:transcriptional regulator with XRE-family HTH domain
MNMKKYLELSDLFGERSLDERMKELAGRLKAYRKKAGYSQLEMADRSGVTYGSLKRFERTGKISLEGLWLLSIALGCDDQLDMLFSRPMLTADDVRNG